MKTVVIFRVFKDGGDVLALFPNEPYNHDPQLCMSYQQIGQHGAAHYSHCMHITRSATVSEASALRRELERLGYELDVRDTKYSR